MELAEPAFSGSCRLARVEVRLGRALVARFDAERGVHLLDGPLRLGEAAVGNARHVPPLERQVIA